MVVFLSGGEFNFWHFEMDTVAMETNLSKKLQMWLLVGSCQTNSPKTLRNNQDTTRNHTSVSVLYWKLTQSSFFIIAVTLPPYRFVCSHYRWIWLPCAVRSLCGQFPFVGVDPTLYINSRTALRRYRLFLWIFGCNVWGSFWWIQGWNWLYYRFYWYMLTILSFHWW